MTAFLTLIEVLVAVSVLIALVSNYLIVNKLWKRRRIREVSESISVSAALLGLSTALPFLLQFLLIDYSPEAALKSLIGIVTGIVFVSVGAGLWVEEFRGEGLWSLVGRALSLEKAESGDLLKSLVQPKGAEEIVEILQRLAAIDENVDAREVQLLQKFAHAWKVQLPEVQTGYVADGGDLPALRRSVEKYLALGPPHEQAGQLIDILQLLAQVDSVMTEEEDIALEETRGLLTRYLGEETDATFEVLIVPQSDAQISAVEQLIPGLIMETRRGGRVFSVGHFYSRRYADVVCQRYIDLGLFTARVEKDALPASF
ncbi:MAG: hypothetical protein ACPHO4_14005 [Longimicrobiales bacterium]